MLKPIWFIIKYWIGWILFFEVARLAFLFSNFTASSQAGLNNFFGALFYGVRMDMSMAAYISLPVCVLQLLAIFLKAFQKRTVYFSYTAIITLPILMLLFADLGLFKAWGIRVDDSFLKYLASPKEAWASISHLPVFAIVLFFVVLYALLLFVIKKWINNIFPSFDYAPKWLAVVLLLLMGLFIIPLRGGFQLAPLNQSSVYFSQNNFSNLSALNPIWNFMRSLTHRTKADTNPFVVMNENDAKSIVDSLFTNNKTPQPEQYFQKPNILLIVWESFTEKAIHAKKNGIEVTPGFNQLKKEGLYFSNIYATGDRTDKGIVGVLSGYPAQPITSIVKLPTKAATLPMLPEAFKKQGYHTAFYYGGELEFANMKAYLMSCGFNQFTSIKDFDKKDQNSKWGAHDEVVMKKLCTDLAKTQQPFFYTWLTLSSHEPFETPVNTVINGNDEESKFLNSLHYTDKVIFDFITQCKQQPWWQNTLVAIVADHGHPLPNLGSKEKNFRIPVLLLGAGIKPSIVSKTGSQNDLAAILSFKAGLPYQQFTWSKNLLDSTVNGWAYFAFNNGYGFVNDRSAYIFDNVGKRPIESRGNDSAILRKKGGAYQQQSFWDYLRR
ncbi:MAG TPA: sulfatase-like hydrolase/transferase [Ferruginibacter sp.]|nr:sulfatase-like hydrolase/transferase [Ferruginibacter sp.]